MKRDWIITLQGNPPTQTTVSTETDSAAQPVIFCEIKVKLKDQGIDPRLVIDWESQAEEGK